jgi:hypothetical protein
VTSAVVEILLNFNEKNLFFAFYLCYSLCSTSEVLLVSVLVWRYIFLFLARGLRPRLGQV